MIKKAFIFVLTIMLFLVCVKAKEKKKYLALGDSITAGYRLANPEEDAFASIFSKKYDFELTNEAVTGDKSSALLEKLPNYNIDDYDVISICIGANDVLRDFIDKFLDLSTEEMIEFLNNVENDEEFNKQIDENLVNLDKNLEKIMEIVKSGHAQIYMMNVYNPYRKNYIPALEKLADKYMHKLNAVIEKYAKEVHFVNLYRGMANKKGILINSQSLTTIYDPHPNVEGHKAIADILGEKYYQNNLETKNLVLAIVVGIIAIALETVEVIYTSKKFLMKPKFEDRPKNNNQEKEEEKTSSSRFIRS